MKSPSEQPQWVKSRLDSLQEKPNCGGTHGGCRCFIEKIIKLEEELARLREPFECEQCGNSELQCAGCGVL